MKKFLANAHRFLFFTGKGGVGKTSMSCSTAVGLADSGKNVLLISTDPASNLDEVLETPLSSSPTQVNNVPNLYAVNINPLKAAEEYRERMVGPYRGILPDAAIEQMEEQLSGACTVEIAGFNEFSKFVGDDTVLADYDHIIMDTAPTGHTLRLLNLPSAWNDFIANNQTGSSCLGPVSGLAEQKELFEKVTTALKDSTQTMLVLVARAESMSLAEAHRAGLELCDTGLSNQHLIINGLFNEESTDTTAQAFALKSQSMLNEIPKELNNLPRTCVGFRPSGVMGISALRDVVSSTNDSTERISPDRLKAELTNTLKPIQNWDSLVTDLESSPNGVIMTMGKGGVGKTTSAAFIATELANKGHKVLLSTTDPAAHITDVIGNGVPNLTIDRIDPEIETKVYVEGILQKNKEILSADDYALLEEELRSPCIEEIAVFQAFARTVAKGQDQFIVLDTAPTGHTLLLLDSTESYHREVAKSATTIPDEVRELLPRIRDPKFTRVLVVTLPESTPVNEASALQDDLRRAGIEPFGWIINRSFAISGTRNETLVTKGFHELPYIQKVADSLTPRSVISPWVAEELNTPTNLTLLKK